nr:hypothetical protein [uncultured Mucilaginibacter sp.]
MMSRIQMIGLTFLILVLIFYWAKRDAVKHSSKAQFSGVVEKVRYDIHNYQFITINGTEYDLNGMKWHHNIPVHIGDTIIKQRGDLRIKLLRRNSRDTIMFDDIQ